MRYTIVCDPKSRKPTYCGNGCESYSIKEFAGYCERCWIQLSPAQRATLQGKEPPVEKVIHTENHTNTQIVRRVYSEGPWLIVACIWLWRIGMSVVAVLLWRAVMK